MLAVCDELGIAPERRHKLARPPKVRRTAAVSFDLFMPVAVALLGRPLQRLAMPQFLASKRERIAYLWQHAPQLLPLTWAPSNVQRVIF